MGGDTLHRRFSRRSGPGPPLSFGLGCDPVNATIELACRSDIGLLCSSRDATRKSVEFRAPNSFITFLAGPSRVAKLVQKHSATEIWPASGFLIHLES